MNGNDTGAWKAIPTDPTFTRFTITCGAWIVLTGNARAHRIISDDAPGWMLDDAARILRRIGNAAEDKAKRGDALCRDDIPALIAEALQ
jgi:hypothetical protein